MYVSLLVLPRIIKIAAQNNALSRIEKANTVFPVSCFFSIRAGTEIRALQILTDSLITKLRSAKTVCPGMKSFNSPLFSVKCLLLTLPPQPSEIKHTVRCGVTPIIYYSVCALARRLEGISTNISVQSY